MNATDVHAGAPRGAEQLGAYVDLLAADEPAGNLLEVRTRRPGRLEMRSWFVDVAARGRLVDVLPSIAARADVYLGVAPRRATNGTRDAIMHAHVAWADVDGVDGAARVAAFMPPPSLVIASGSGGVHAYWALARPADTVLVEQITQRLAGALGGDPVWAATTILRPPATWNHKHDPPRAVGLVDRSAASYDPDALLASLAPITPNISVSASARESRAASADPLLAIAPRVYVERLLGVTVPRSGFIACPWHSDRTPSFKVYETPERGWYCYSRRCRRGGSIYDLAARVWGLDTRAEAFVLLRERLLAIFPAAAR